MRESILRMNRACVPLVLAGHRGQGASAQCLTQKCFPRTMICHGLQMADRLVREQHVFVMHMFQLDMLFEIGMSLNVPSQMLLWLWAWDALDQVVKSPVTSLSFLGAEFSSVTQFTWPALAQPFVSIRCKRVIVTFSSLTTILSAYTR